MLIKAVYVGEAINLVIAYASFSQALNRQLYFEKKWYNGEEESRENMGLYFKSQK